MTSHLSPGANLFADDFAETGRVWLRGAVAGPELQRLAELSATKGQPGTRIGAAAPLSAAITDAGFSARIARLWPGMRPVRIVSFTKSEDANWGLPWHQDRVIAVDRRADLPGYGNWSRKDGVWHCEPPDAILRRMLFVRVHLDPSHARNGAMEIALGSHKAGRLGSAEARERAEACPREITEAAPGDVLILAMHMLHRSRRATTDGSRRVLRIDYSAEDLPAPLRWASQTGG